MLLLQSMIDEKKPAVWFSLEFLNAKFLAIEGLNSLEDLVGFQAILTIEATKTPPFLLS